MSKTPATPPRLSEPQRDLAAANVRLVHYLLRRYGTFGLDYDDAAQEGCAALLRAAATFDPARQVKFSTYASRVVLRHLSAVCSQRRYRRLCLRSDLALERLCCAPQRREPRLGCDLDAALRRLASSDRRLLLRHYHQGVGPSVLAIELGTNRKAVHQRLRVARLRLKAILTGEKP